MDASDGHESEASTGNEEAPLKIKSANIDQSVEDVLPLPLDRRDGYRLETLAARSRRMRPILAKDPKRVRALEYDTHQAAMRAGAIWRATDDAAWLCVPCGKPLVDDRCPGHVRVVPGHARINA